MASFPKKSFLAVSALALVSACATPQNFDPNSPDVNQTQAGTIIGGMVGAIAGMAVSSDDDRTKGAILGAAIGAGAGNLIGQRLDQQEADLRAQMGNNSVQIENTGSELIVTMPQDILFAVDSASLRPDLQRDLRTVAGNLIAYPDSIVQIVGHTDNTGDAAYNQGLSQRRAESVASVLIQNGVTPGRIRSFGRGESAPIATNLTPEGRRQNRRVEIIIQPTR